MGIKRSAGLFNRKGVWHIDKQILGRRICESTGESSLEKAEQFLAMRAEEIRQAMVYGIRPVRDFTTAAAKFLLENTHLASIDRYADALKAVKPYIGKLALNKIHMGCLQGYIEDGRTKRKVKTRTINYGLQAVRRVLNLAATEWIDEHGLTWLATAPKIKLLAEHDKSLPNPLQWEEQNKLFGKLPKHLKNMALFAVNTGCREAEVCALQWDWEVDTGTDAGGSIFIIPKYAVKNREERVVILNKDARDVVEQCRGQHAKYVFTYRGRRLTKMNQDGWQDNREAVNLKNVRVHDLKHTFGARLRAVGVSFEDRQDLLGHKSGRITTHYSMAELNKLYEAANKVCVENGNYPKLRILKRRIAV